MMHEVTVNLDLFGALMKKVIMGNLYGTSIVTMNGRTSSLRGTMSVKTSITTKTQ
jgi:hypothetical protein